MRKMTIALAVAALSGSAALAADKPVSIHHSAGVPKMSKSQEKRMRRSLGKHKGRK